MLLADHVTAACHGHEKITHDILDQIEGMAKEGAQVEASRCSFFSIDITDKYLSGVHYNDCLFEEVIFDRSIVNNCSWKGCKTKKLSFEFASCENSTFLSCDLSNSSWYGSSLSDVHFSNCKLTGANFLNSRSLATKFDECVLVMACMRNMSFKDQVVLRNDFSDADFYFFFLILSF